MDEYIFLLFNKMDPDILFNEYVYPWYKKYLINAAYQIDAETRFIIGELGACFYF